MGLLSRSWWNWFSKGMTDSFLFLLFLAGAVGGGRSGFLALSLLVQRVHGESFVVEGSCSRTDSVAFLSF